MYARCGKRTNIRSECDTKIEGANHGFGGVTSTSIGTCVINDKEINLILVPLSKTQKASKEVAQRPYRILSQEGRIRFASALNSATL